MPADASKDAPVGALLAGEPADASRDAGVIPAAYQAEELPPVDIINPAAESIAPLRSDDSSLAPASVVTTLDDVVASVYSSYPALDAAARERQIAAGKELAKWGAFDSIVVADALSEALGYYENYRYELGVKQYNWGGAQSFAGYRLGRGSFEPWYLERETNRGGEFKTGVILPFLRDRDIDKRRAAVFKAQLDRTAAEPLLQLEVIDAVRAASLAYWDWVAAGRKASIARENEQLAVDRQSGLQTRVARGDMAGIALVDNERLIVSRRAKLIEAEQKLNLAAIKLSLFLRDVAGTPLLATADQLPPDFPPVEPADGVAVDLDVAQALARRPELWLLQLESERAAVEIRQASNLTLPAFDGVVAGSQDVGAPTSEKRDKSQFELEAGVQFEVPLQRREAIGKLRAAQAKLAQIAAKRRLSEQKIVAQVQGARTTLAAAYAGLKQAERNVELARQMEDAERTKFERGDSDLLFVNIREQATADAAVLAVDAAATYFMARAQLHAAIAGELSGVLPMFGR
jgi:outer membrane protein TolC